MKPDEVVGSYVANPSPRSVEEEEVGLCTNLPGGDLLGAGTTGFLTGFLGSMAGVGGGPFCVPLLGTLLGLSHLRCVGTSILCGLTTLTVGGITAFLSASSLDIPLTGIVVLGVVAPIFGYISARLTAKISQPVLKQVFAWFLLFCALQILYKLAYSPTGVEGHWEYSLSGRPQLKYEVEGIGGRLVFRTQHFHGVLHDVHPDELNKYKEHVADFADGWYVPLINTDTNTRGGTIWLRVLDRGSTLETLLHSTKDHWNAKVVATRQKAWYVAFFSALLSTWIGQVVFHLVLAVIAGSASGLLGIAGGSVVVPMMSLTGAFPWQVITTTSLLSMIPTSATTCYTHHQQGNVVLKHAPGLVFGTVTGAFTGSRLMAFMSEVVRKSACAGVLLFTAAIMLYQGSKSSRERASLQWLGGGVVFFYCLAALLQEKVFNLPEFAHEYMMTFLQSLMVGAFAFLDLNRGGLGREVVGKATSERKCPLVVYMGMAILTSVSALCTNKASTLLDYTTQVVFKSSKLPWIMVWRLLFLPKKRRPTTMEWVWGLVLSVGLGFFTFAGARSMASVTEAFWMGLASILVALCCDASLYVVEEGVVFGRYNADKHEVILFLQALSIPTTFVFVAASGSLGVSWMYLWMEWRFPTLILAFAMCNYLGTRCLLQIVQEYDANMATVTTSIRKAATVLLSYAFFPKRVTLLHVVGLLMVGCGAYCHVRAARMADEASGETSDPKGELSPPLIHADFTTPTLPRSEPFRHL